MLPEITKTWDEQRLRRERLQRLQREMKKFGLGALFLSDPANLQYVLNVRVRASKVFVPVEGEPLAIVRPRDIGYVSMEYDNVRLPVRGAGSGPEPPGRIRFSPDVIADLMKQHGVVGEPLGIDEVDGGSVVALMRSRISVTDAEPVLEAARSTKTQDEVAMYRSIAIEYVHAMKAFREAITPGVSEHQIASAVAAAWYEVGGEDIAELEVCSGDRTNPWHRWPSRRIVQAGEFVAIDFHGRGCGGLIGDLSRTYLSGGAPSVQQRDLYARAHDYLLAATETLRAGRLITEVLDLVPRVPEKYAAQLYNYNIAHSIGMVWAGYPEVNKSRRRANDVLEPNHVLTVESYFGEKGSPIAVKLERMVVVRDGEPEVLDLAIALDEGLLT